MNVLPSHRESLFRQARDEKQFPVFPFARVVPNGIVKTDGNFRLKATVLLTPKPFCGEKEAINGDFSLSHWTEDVLKAILDGGDGREALTIPLTVRPAPIGKTFPAGKLMLEKATVRWAGEHANIRNELSGFLSMWQQTFLRRGVEWKDLSDALAFSFGGSGFKAGSELESKDVEGVTDPRNPDRLPPVGLQGEIDIDTTPNQSREVDGIYSQGHADMALALEYGRLNRIAAEIKNGRDASFLAEEMVWKGDKAPPLLESDTKTKKAMNDAIREAREKRRQEQFKELDRNHAIGRAAYAAELNEAKLGLVSHCKELDDKNDSRPAPAKLILNEDTCDTCLKDGRNAHAYLTPAMRRKNQISENKCDVAQRCAAEIFFAVQSTGALSRLYCLAFDIEYELKVEDLKVLAGWKRDEDVLFLRVSARDKNNRTLGSKAECKPPWTVTKLTYRNGAIGDSSGDFWPVTREEVLAVRHGKREQLSRFTSQLDGYRVTGECWRKKDGLHTPRFDLTSLDIRSATEQELSGDANEASSSAGQVVTTAFHTAGMAILDRGMQAEKARKLARKECCDFGSDTQLLYADDLTIGFRLDVGVPDKDTVKWSPLNLRKVDYGTSGPLGNQADKLLPLLAGSYRDPARLAFEAGMITMPEQLVPKKDSGAVDLAVAENTVTWEGAPLGVETLQPLVKYEDGSKRGKNIARPLDALPFGRRIFLPSGTNKDDEGIARPPRLRFGWPYRFAMRAVYSGGTSVSPGSVDWVEDSYDSRLTFPGVSTKGGSYKPAYFRFLRQKPVDPPVLLMPLAEALNRNEDQSPIGKTKTVMGYQEASRVVVRSIFNGTPGKGRAQPSIAYRAFLPPVMAMDEVARHGVLDRRKGGVDGLDLHPAGAFPHIRWDKVRDTSGFPVLQVASILGFNGTWLPEKDRQRADLKSPQIARKITGELAANKEPRRKTSFTSPVFCRRQNSRKEDQQYYPDPFAQILVINMRHAGTSLPFADPIQVLIYKGGSAESTRPDPKDALPVLLKFDASQEGKPWSKRFVSLTSDGRPRSTTSESGADAIEVSIYLPAGLKFDLDCFFVPARPVLASKSALVQAMTVAAGLHGDALNNADLEITGGEVAKGAEKLLGTGFANQLKKVLEKMSMAPKKRDYLLGSPGGLPVPEDDVLAAVAKVLQEQCIRSPVADLTGVTRLTCEHASDAVADIRQRIRLADPIFHRVGRKSFDNQLKKWFAKPTNKDKPVPDESIIVDNETDALLQGVLEIDLLRISGFDLVVEMESPGNGVFDDKTRKRDLASVRAGTWPVIRDVEGDAYIKNARQIFGFDVAPGGKVELPRADVVLFKVRDLPSELAGEFERNDNGLTRIQLLHLLYGVQAADGQTPLTPQTYGDARIEELHTFSDCVGRNVRIKLKPYLRSLPSLRTADRLVNGEHVVGEPYMIDKQRDKPLLGPEALLPSSVRPAQLAVRGPLQCFDWLVSSKSKSDDVGRPEQSVPPLLAKQMQSYPVHAWAKRRPVIRLNLDRSWFSSDANEKVALVFWPPDQGCQSWLQETSPKLLNKIRYRRNIADDACGADDNEELRNIVLADFQDEDLGPGGQFTTRLGADPLKLELPDPRIFLHYSDFLPAEAGSHPEKLENKPDGIPLPRLVQNALMPVSTLKDVGGEQEDKGFANRSVSRFMSVGLLVYEPRFDPENESWFIEVSLNKTVRFVEPFIRFGLVRYNDNPAVDRERRVSAPAVVWAKHMPERTVQARFDPSTRRLFVQVDGPALGTGLEARGDDNSRQDMPSLHARVVREGHRELNGKTVEMEAGQDHSEIVTRQPVRLTKGPLHIEPGPTGKPRQVRHDREGAGWISLGQVAIGLQHSCWVTAAELDLDDELRDGERLVLFVEEVEQYRPASYADEPVDPEIFKGEEINEMTIKDYLVETGPRFSCRIELSGVGKSETGGLK